LRFRAQPADQSFLFTRILDIVSALFLKPKLSDFLLDLHRSLAHQDLGTFHRKKSLNL
jgi:hypothetical protein